MRRFFNLIEQVLLFFFYFPLNFEINLDLFFVLDVFFGEDRLFAILSRLESIEMEGASFHIFRLIFMISTSSRLVHEGFGDKVLHDNFIPLNLLLSFNFNIFEFGFRLWILKP